MLPSGKASKEHMDECTCLILEWVDDNQFQSIAIKALMIMSSLLLQKCSRNSKAKDPTGSLQRRPKLWKEGDFDRAVMTTFRRSTLVSAGDLQLCASQRARCETAVHALSSMFSEYDSDAIFLENADNAFNRINRNVMLHNI